MTIQDIMTQMSNNTAKSKFASKIEVNSKIEKMERMENDIVHELVDTLVGEYRSANSEYSEREYSPEDCEKIKSKALELLKRAPEDLSRIINKITEGVSNDKNENETEGEKTEKQLDNDNKTAERIVIKATQEPYGNPMGPVVGM